MKKFYILFSALFITSLSFGQVFASDNFSYADGSLVGNGTWATHSGTPLQVMVLSGQVTLAEDGTVSEDVNLPFAPVSGKVYFGIDITVTAAAAVSGGDYEYFAHFKDSGFGFFGRVDVVAPNTTGDYTLGLSTDTSSAQATWPTDLTFGQTYRITVMYDQDANVAQLWIDASADTDPSILGTDQPDPGSSMAGFALRQSNSSSDERITVDNLVIGTTFALSTKENQIDGFDLYPNPTSSAFVNISSDNRSPMKVSVYDILGKQVIDKTVTNNRLNISNLNTGVYILRAQQDNAFTTRKLVIN